MCTCHKSHLLYEENMIKSVTKLNEYDAFINSFLEDSNFSDPHLTQRLEAGEKPEDMLTKKDHLCFVTENSDGINGVHKEGKKEPADCLLESTRQMTNGLSIELVIKKSEV